MLFRVIFLILLVLSPQASRAEIIGSCRWLFAENRTRASYEYLERLQQVHLLPGSPLYYPALPVQFLILDKDHEGLRKWVLDVSGGAPHGEIYKAYVFALASLQEEMAITLFNALSLGPEDRHFLHDLIDVTLYLNATNVASVFKKPRNFSLNTSRLSALLPKVAREGWLAGVQTLVTLGADVNTLNWSHFTPLMLAIAGDHYEVFSYLLSQPQIDLSVRGNSFNDALAIAKHYDRQRMIRDLLAHPQLRTQK